MFCIPGFIGDNCEICELGLIEGKCYKRYPNLNEECYENAHNHYDLFCSKCSQGYAMPLCFYCEMGYQMGLDLECVDCSIYFILAGAIPGLDNQISSNKCVKRTDDMTMSEYYFH